MVRIARPSSEKPAQVAPLPRLSSRSRKPEEAVRRYASHIGERVRVLRTPRHSSESLSAFRLTHRRLSLYHWRIPGTRTEARSGRSRAAGAPRTPNGVEGM